MKKLAILLMVLMLAPICLVPVVSAELPLRVVVNGNKVSFPDEQPFIDANGRTQTPARYVSQALGAVITWEPKAKKAIFFRQGNKLTLFVGKKEYEVNGQKKQMDTNALLINGRIFVPARYVAEGLGATARWESSIRTVYIDTNTTPAPVVEDPVNDWIKEETNVVDVEYALSIQWSEDKTLLNKRYDAAEKMFAARYGADITKQVFAYVRKKQTREYSIKLTKIKYNGQTITVFAQDIGVEINVWKKGVLL